MEYDLSRLSSRSFEQLVQALAVRHFGPGVVIFGDGADGGREATFRGAGSFAPHGTPWEGTCVVQAKFRQRPLGTEIDGPWALNALKGELDKFAKEAGGRPQPDNYIFATNAVLSPGTGGTKDQATQELEAAKADWGLLDYQVWDYDKLRTWLDVDEETRTRFGWITAGDVLATMLRAIEGSNPNFERAIVNYLEKTLVADRFVRLEEAGHSAEEPTPLSNVFVDLPIAGARPGREDLFMRGLLEQTASLRSLEASDSEIGRRIVLVGGPGQGKTTVGQFACQVFRASLLAERPHLSISPEGRTAIEAVRVACDAEGLPFGRGPRFPLRVVLTDLAKALADSDQSLLTYLATLVSERVGTSVSTEVFRHWLASYPWFLVLDGLDEVPANAGRERVMRCITDFWVDAAQVGADVVVLATTRPQGYNNDFSPERHEHLLLAELPPSRALDYGSRLAEARYGKDTDRTNAVKERLGRAASEPTTAHLMRSPLQVAIMTALVDRYGQPPHERWSLFDAYYDVIYQRERERDTEAANILREYRPDIDTIHQHVGLALQVLTTHEGHSDPRLTGGQLERLIDARLAAEGHDGSGTVAMAAQIRSAAELRLVFLVGAESDRIGFEIRSLQEFMAAGALVAGPDEQVIRRLSAVAPLPAWRNVLLFGAGECFVGRQYLRNQIHALCRELDVDGGQPLIAAARTGARLALDLLEDRTARRQPRHHRVIAKHALEMLDCADEETAGRLARCHDENLDDLYRTALSVALASSDEISETNARRCLIGLDLLNISWAAQVLRDHLPATPRGLIDMLEEAPLEGTQTLAIDDPSIAACLELATHGELQSLVNGPLGGQLPWSKWLRVTHVEQLPVSYAKGIDLGITSLPGAVQGAGESARSRSAIDDGTLCSSPTVAVYLAADRFLVEPNQNTLSETLEELAQSSTPEAWERCAYSVPWPLGAALIRSKTADQLVVEAGRARVGALGTIDDWHSAEDSWPRTTSLLDSLTAEPVPFPIEVATAAINYASLTGGFPWLDVFRSLPKDDDIRRPALARLMLWVLGAAGSASGSRTLMSDAIDVARAARGPQYIEIGILDADEGGSSTLETLLEALGGDTRFFYRSRPVDHERYRPDTATIGRLERYANEHPSTRSIEALAAGLASTTRPAGLSISVPAHGEDPVAQSAAAFVALVTDSGGIDGRALGRRFVISQDQAMWSLLTSPNAQLSPSWGDFLVGLQETTPRQWQLHRGVSTMISEVLSRLPTPLADAETWRALGLFDPHPLALTAEG